MAHQHWSVWMPQVPDALQQMLLLVVLWHFGDLQLDSLFSSKSPEGGKTLVPIVGALMGDPEQPPMDYRALGDYKD
eukprot:CAMPEP_0184493900 /NCGR_PEP_ID=MMETSP0113_2-20130426/27260_1 /TAXON_ID=91329 /ORGANISM="Norrisiella sphaerica, Strain BC52" /LENGTH=75 /DNA_ID=CAMNT_0026879383 /DNA_START=922 /DNA_END=1149 /DNA_ORIENTATION=+